MMGWDLAAKRKKFRSTDHEAWWRCRWQLVDWSSFTARMHVSRRSLHHKTILVDTVFTLKAMDEDGLWIVVCLPRPTLSLLGGCQVVAKHLAA